MRTLILQRISYFHKGEHKGTTGVMLDQVGLVPFCLTLELPWKQNKKNISCIPAGVYHCKKTSSPKFGETYEVTEVQNRTHIVFHKGNLDEHTKGCILLGESFGLLEGEPAILSSRDAFTEFKYKLRNENEFILDLRSPAVYQNPYSSF